jgi:tetratricopeptide (TPR) repeat protein
MKTNNSFSQEAMTEALFLWGTLVVGIVLGTGVAALLYVLGIPESSAVMAGFVTMVVLSVLSEVFYRIGCLPWNFLRIDRENRVAARRSDEIEDLKTILQQQPLDRESSDSVKEMTFKQLEESAQSLEEEDRYREAAERYEEAFRKAIEENASKDELARLYAHALWPNRALSEYEKCISLANKIISLSENGGVSDWPLGEAYYALSNVYYDLGEYDLAEQYAKETIDSCPSFPNYGSRINLALIKHNLGDWKEAELELKNILILSKQSQNKRTQAIVLNDLAFFYATQERLFEALESCFASLSLRIEEEGYEYTRGVAYCNSNLGNIYLRLKQWDMAELFLINAIELFSKLGDLSNVADQYYDLALITLERGHNPEVAKDYAQKFVDYFQNPNLKPQQAKGKRLMGMIYAELNIYGEAQQLLQESIEMLRSIGHRYELALSCYELGLIKQKLGQKTEAVEYLMEAKNIFQNLYVPDKDRLERKIELVNSALGEPQQTMQLDETKKMEIQRSLEVMEEVLNPEQYVEVARLINNKFPGLASIGI